ncbi:MAG: peptidase M20, partial [Candidatus Methanomethylicota archaeon]
MMNEHVIVNEVDENLDELIKLLQDVIRIDTSNPPGNEIRLANFLFDVFSREGIPCEVVESTEGRGNVIARLNGESGKVRLLYLSHLDVVPAVNASSWAHNPFSGHFDGKWIYGRGAIDCKGLVVAGAFAMILLKRLNINPKCTIIYASTADEEVGGEHGLGWIVKNMPEKVKANYVINEGGGVQFKLGGRSVVYPVDVGE